MSVAFAFWTPGPVEICVIGLVALLIFGRNLPKMAASLGKAIPSFKRGVAEGKREVAEVEEEIKQITEGTAAAVKTEVDELVGATKQAGA